MSIDLALTAKKIPPPYIDHSGLGDDKKIIYIFSKNGVCTGKVKLINNNWSFSLPNPRELQIKASTNNLWKWKDETINQLSLLFIKINFK